MHPLANFKLRVVEIRLSQESVQHVESLCRILAGIADGDELPDGKQLGAHLAALNGLFDPPHAAVVTRWQAEYLPAPSGNGGALSIKEKSGEMFLGISHTRSGTLYGGMWARLSDENPAFLTFEVRIGSDGREVVLGGEETERVIPLGVETAGLRWSAADEVLSFVPDWLRGAVSDQTRVSGSPPNADKTVLSRRP